MARPDKPLYSVRLAQNADDLRAAQRLRYEVFVGELGGKGAMVDHAQQLERDRFDDFVDHLILTRTGAPEVIGVYRLLREEGALKAGGFYSETEYDLDVLKSSGRPLLELGRSCIHPDHRGGMALHALWSGLGAYVAEHGIEIMFGVASFHGTDALARAAPLSLLHHKYLAPPALRVTAHGDGRADMNLIEEASLDRAAAMVQVPTLIKSYLRLGGCVGDGAFIDHAFNTIDVCLVLDTAQMSARQAKRFGAVRS